MTPTEKLQDAIARVERLITLSRALRVHRLAQEWPRNHSEAPSRPAWFEAFEREHGLAPESAIAVLGREGER